jgi:mono/diheme cytochrome c family protein
MITMRALFASACYFAAVGVAFADGQDFDRIERGRYLAVLADCAACHTKPGGAPFSGGLALQTPFGTLVAPNITPDRETGIGDMSDAEFLSSLHDGRGRNGLRLYPAMPYPAYTKMSDDDVLAIRAYLATVAPVSNRVVANQLPFPFSVRLSMLFWNTLNFAPGRYQPNPQKSASWNRGAYIVEGAAHCGTCHTPKTMLGGDKNEQALTGATLQGWFAPDITNDPHKGIGGWSKDDLVQYLKTGANNWTLASGPMAEAVTHSTSRMTDEDIAAIAIYLKDSGKAAADRQRSPRRLPRTTRRCARALRSTRTVAPPATGIPAQARPICFRASPAARWCSPTMPRRWCAWCCRARARRRPQTCRRRLPCRPSTGGWTTRRSQPSSPTSGTVGAMRPRRSQQATCKSNGRRWPRRLKRPAHREHRQHAEQIEKLTPRSRFIGRRASR